MDKEIIVILTELEKQIKSIALSLNALQSMYQCEHAKTVGECFYCRKNRYIGYKPVHEIPR
jgi:hypothetical protein